MQNSGSIGVSSVLADTIPNLNWSAVESVPEQAQRVAESQPLGTSRISIRATGTVGPAGTPVVHDPLLPNPK